MIELNLHHPKYDIGMEVLCTLSTRPAPRRLIAEDLGVANIRSVITELRQRGFNVRAHRVGNEIHYAIPPEDWRHVRNAANRYWKLVYESKEPTHAA